MFEALKSRNMIGFSAPCRKARPLAAPIAIFIRVAHGSEAEIPIIQKIDINTFTHQLEEKNKE